MSEKKETILELPKLVKLTRLLISYIKGICHFRFVQGCNYELQKNIENGSEVNNMLM
jgi:hypothetical protein